MTRDVAALLAANGCFFAAGSGVLRLFGAWQAGLAYMTGVATVGVILTVGYVAGLSWVVWEVLLLCAALAALGLFGRRGERVVSTRASRPERLLAGGCALALGAYVAALFAKAVVQPLNSWDAWVIWTAKARALVLFDGLDPRVFANHAYASLHLDYPLLLPALEAIDFRFMGRFDTLVIHVQFPLLLLGFLAAARELLRERVPAALLWPGLLLVGMTPALGTQLLSAYADVPLALFFSLAALAGWRFADDGDRRWLVPFGLFGGAAAATKFEGMAFVVALFLIVLVLSRVRRRPLLSLLLPAAAVVLAVVPWRIWVSNHGLRSSSPVGKTFEPSYLADQAHKLGPIARSLARVSLDHHWLYALPLVALAIVLVLAAARVRSAGVFALAVLAAAYASLVWAYVLSRAQIDWYLRTSAHRVVTTALVFAGIFVPVLAAELARTLTNHPLSRRPETRRSGLPGETWFPPL